MPTHRRRGRGDPSHRNTHIGIYSTQACIRPGKLEYTHTGQLGALLTLRQPLSIYLSQALQVSVSQRYYLILLRKPPHPYDCAAISIIPDQFSHIQLLLPAHYPIQPLCPPGKIREAGRAGERRWVVKREQSAMQEYRSKAWRPHQGFALKGHPTNCITSRVHVIWSISWPLKPIG